MYFSTSTITAFSHLTAPILSGQKFKHLLQIISTPPGFWWWMERQTDRRERWKYGYLQAETWFSCSALHHQTHSVAASTDLNTLWQPAKTHTHLILFYTKWPIYHFCKLCKRWDNDESWGWGGGAGVTYIINDGSVPFRSIWGTTVIQQTKHQGPDTEPHKGNTVLAFFSFLLQNVCHNEVLAGKCYETRAHRY